MIISTLIFQHSYYASNKTNAWWCKWPYFLLHTLERRNGKGLYDLLDFKPCESYMGNLNTLFTNKFREKEPPIVFHKEHWSKILGSILGMKTDYCRNHNIKLVNTKQRSGKWIYLFRFLYTCTELHYCHYGSILLMIIIF